MENILQYSLCKTPTFSVKFDKILDRGPIALLPPARTPLQTTVLDVTDKGQGSRVKGQILTSYSGLQCDPGISIKRNLFTLLFSGF